MFSRVRQRSPRLPPSSSPDPTPGARLARETAATRRQTRKTARPVFSNSAS